MSTDKKRRKSYGVMQKTLPYVDKNASFWVEKNMME
jgi:hypothetical protein